jgi:hypothetical protein
VSDPIFDEDPEFMAELDWLVEEDRRKDKTPPPPPKPGCVCEKKEWSAEYNAQHQSYDDVLRAAVTSTR